MNELLNSLTKLPLWAIVLSVVILLYLTQYWLTVLAGKLLPQLAPMLLGYTRLIRTSIGCAGLAALITFFWIGTGARGNFLEWGIYGRGAFILLTIGFTRFFYVHVR